MKQKFYLLLFIGSIVNAMQVSNNFAEKINKSNEIEKETLVLQEKINKELVNNISIKANILKKTDENYMRAGTEKSLTGIYIFGNSFKGSTK